MCSRWQVRGIAALAVLSLAAGSGLAMAQAPGTETGNSAAAGTPGEAAAASPSSSQLSKADKLFMHRAAEGGLAEVELGKLAQQKGNDQAVKSFGERMVTDHSQANDKLMTLAQSMNVQLPSKLGKKDQKTLDRLQSKSGDAFDKAYASAMRRDHRMDIREFEHEAKHGENAQVKEFAQTTLPTLKEHLSLAEKELPGASRTASASKAPTTPAER